MLRAPMLILALTGAWAPGCKGGGTGCPTGARWVQERTAEGQARFCALPGGAKHGRYAITRADGSSEAGLYRFDRRDGAWIARRDGRVLAEVTYSAELSDCGDASRDVDCRHGEMIEYDQSGARWGVTPWVRGRRHGWAVRFEPDGAFRGAVCFENDEPTTEVRSVEEMNRTRCPRGGAGGN